MERFYSPKHRKIMSYIVNDLEQRFKNSPFNTVLCTVSLKSIDSQLGINAYRSWKIVEDILRTEGIRYEHKSSRQSGARFQITISRKEFRRLKEKSETTLSKKS